MMIARWPTLSLLEKEKRRPMVRLHADQKRRDRARAYESHTIFRGGFSVTEVTRSSRYRMAFVILKRSAKITRLEARPDLDRPPRIDEVVASIRVDRETRDAQAPPGWFSRCAIRGAAGQGRNLPPRSPKDLRAHPRGVDRCRTRLRRTDDERQRE